MSKPLTSGQLAAREKLSKRADAVWVQEWLAVVGGNLWRITGHTVDEARQNLKEVLWRKYKLVVDKHTKLQKDDEHKC